MRPLRRVGSLNIAYARLSDQMVNWN